MSSSNTTHENRPRYVLFVAGSEPNSEIARGNFARICREMGIDDDSAEVIDVFEDFTTAFEQGVMVTPTLHVILRGRKVEIIGNLQDFRIDAIDLGIRGNE